VSDNDLAETGAPDFDSARFRQVMGHFCTGVTVVTGLSGGAPAGFTAVSFTSVSLDPPLVSICATNTSKSWPAIQASGAFCVNILAEDQEALCREFAMSGGDKFRGVGWTRSHGTGSPLLNDVLAWVDCRIEQEYQAGDHTIVLGRVVDLGIEEEGAPLLFFRGGYGGFEP